jgi:ATPase component of Mn/Zn ABC-type transporter
MRSAVERKAEIERLAGAVGIRELLESAIGRLSGGQLQRALLARALASQPELLILDEPLSFLDRAYKQSFEALLEALVPEETTMLMVTHDIAGSGAGAWQELKLDEYAR